MTHPQKFLIVGFNDASWKWRGDWQLTFFAPEHHFVADHIPSQDEMRSHAERLGYWPSGKRGSTLEKCAPVYTHIGDGTDYTNCPICFPRTEIIDNRVGEG